MQSILGLHAQSQHCKPQIWINSDVRIDVTLHNFASDFHQDEEIESNMLLKLLAMGHDLNGQNMSTQHIALH